MHLFYFEQEQLLPAPLTHTPPQGRNRKIFLRGQSHFSWFFFPAWNAISRWKISILVHPKQISVVLKSEKAKKIPILVHPNKFQWFWKVKSKKKKKKKKVVQVGKKIKSKFSNLSPLPTNSRPTPLARGVK